MGTTVTRAGSRLRFVIAFHIQCLMGMSHTSKSDAWSSLTVFHWSPHAPTFMIHHASQPSCWLFVVSIALTIVHFLFHSVHPPLNPAPSTRSSTSAQAHLT